MNGCGLLRPDIAELMPVHVPRVYVAKKLEHIFNLLRRPIRKRRVEDKSVTVSRDQAILKASSQRVTRPVEGDGKWAVHRRVEVSQKRPNSSRRVRPAWAES